LAELYLSMRCPSNDS